MTEKDEMNTGKLEAGKPIWIAPSKERPLIEGIDAYRESLKEGARREREQILKLIDEKIHQYDKNELNGLFWIGYKEALNELKGELEK